MGEQMPQPHRFGQSFGGAVRAHHAKVGEGRDVFGDRVIQLQDAGLVQHQGGDSGDRLGHRIEPDQVVGTRRPVGRQVGHAAAVEKGDLAMASDQGGREGQFAGRHIARGPVTDPVQLPVVEADAFG